MTCVSSRFAVPRRWIQCLNSPYYSGRGWTTANGLCPLGGGPCSVEMPKSRAFAEQPSSPVASFFDRLHTSEQEILERCHHFPVSIAIPDRVQSASAKFARRLPVTIMSCMRPAPWQQSQPIQSVLCAVQERDRIGEGELQGDQRDQQGALTIGRGYAFLVSAAPP